MIPLDDTIVAIATPLGEGGLGVIRISGPDSFQIADHLFQSHSKKKSGAEFLLKAPSHTLHHGSIISKEGKIDDAVASVFKSPQSYTGEDVVEFSCHGSPSVLKEILRLCQDEGARLARPGEFTERAFLNGKMDLAQAEAVADLIHSRSEAARRQAMDQLEGELSRRIKNIREGLLHLLASLEANFDFVEEDIPPTQKKVIEEGLKIAEGELTSLLSTSLRGKLLREGARVAILGRPNAGKSSLFNALLAFDRAIVTSLPGTTRDTLEENLDWNGISVTLVDTAGLRQTKDQLELLGIERTNREKKMADFCLFLIDSTTSFTSDDEDIIRSLDPTKTMLVVTKTDLPLKWDIKQCPSIEKFRHIVHTSASKGKGLIELKEALVRHFEEWAPSQEGNPVLVHERHVIQVEKALKKVTDAIFILSDNKSDEALSLDIRGAVQELGQITGEDASEDLLKTIFSQFCIGK